MEVTNLNFNTVFPEIEKAIENSLFVSIDCELSGLNVARNINAFDTPNEYYMKMRKNCKSFLIMQYGISTFRYDETDNNFKHRSYNFYIFRRPINKNVPDIRFLCQSSSIDFLINNGFDFNKLFKEGISYLTEEEADRYRSNVEQSYLKALDIIDSKQTEVTCHSIPIPDNAINFIDDIRMKIDNFILNNETELQLPKCNAYYRKLIYQIKEEKYYNKISLETRHTEKDRILFVTKIKTIDEEKQLARERYEDNLKELEDCRGFTKVLKSLIKSDKLIIGHNACLDFFHTIDKFLTQLPESYQEFKQMSHSLFSRVLDTKYMSSSEPFRDLIQSTVLKQLLDTVSEKPFGLPVLVTEDGRGYELEDGKEHEAGYDAFVTGVCFLGMWKHLGLLDNRDDRTTFNNMKLLEPYFNKLFLMTLTDNQFINLSGEDLYLSRDHVFYLTFPEEWKLINIQQLFSPFGSVSVSWIDDTSAYVGLYKRDQAAVCFKALQNGNDYTIQRFVDRKKQISNGKVVSSVPSAIPAKKRKSSESPAPKNKKRDNTAINKALSKMTIESETAIVKSTAKSKTFREDPDWT